MAAPDSGFTTLQMFSKLLILQISVQQDTQPSACENPGLSLPGLERPLMEKLQDSRFLPLTAFDLFK